MCIAPEAPCVFVVLASCWRPEEMSLQVTLKDPGMDDKYVHFLIIRRSSLINCKKNYSN